MRYIGYFISGIRFAITLDEYPELLVGANWAAWDSRAQLWVVRPGIGRAITRSTICGAARLVSLDVDRFEPPPKPLKEP